MAGIADMIVNNAFANADKVPDIGGSLQKGAELGATVQNIQAQRQQMEMAKEQHRVNKADKIMNAIEVGSKFTDKRAQDIYFKQHIPSMIRALKMDDVFSPEVMPYIQGSAEVRDKIIGLKLDIQDKINNGELRGAAILNYAKDRLSPEELPLLDTSSLLDQQKFATAEANKAERAQTMASASMGKQVQAQQSAGKVELAKKTAADYAAFTSGGGLASAQDKIKKLEKALNKLETGKVKTGTMSKLIPGLGSDRGQAVVDPEFKALADDVRGAISLKGQLDSQFSSKEAEIQFNRALDGALPNEQNVEKVRSMLNQLKGDLKSKTQEFKQQGFISENSTVSNKLSELSGRKADFQRVKETDKPRVIEALAKKYDVSIAEVKKLLGVK